MGAADFPLPRHELPAIKTTPREHQEAKELVEHMLAHTVLEFEKFVYRDQNHVDPRIWKSFGSRDRLKVYKQREGGLMHAVRTQRLDSMSELPSESILAAMQPGSLMMSGYWPGKVENAMYAVVTKSQEELALVVIYLHEDVADCALLNVMEAPTEEEPYRFLGYKYFVRKSPTNAHIVRNRDSLYLEYCGMTKTSTGEQIGFHIMHSVDLPGFPDLKSRNSVRAVQSVRYIYRQKSENIVEIFMLGNMDISGHLGGLKSISSFFTADTLFGIARLVDCAEAKRLTDMVRARQQHIGLLQAKEKGVDCSICRQRKSLFKSATLTECTTCGQYVCARCWLYKKVFIPDAEVILGKFHKVCVCKTCVLAANAGYYEEPRIHVSLSRHGDRKTSRHRADSSTITGSYASDSGSEYSSSNGRSGSVYSSESSHSNGTQQAHYHTQFHSTPHSDRGGFHHRMRRTVSRENRYDAGEDTMLYRPTLSDISSDLIPLEPVPSSPDNMMMVVHPSSHRHPHSYDSQSVSSSVTSSRYFTPPTPTALPVGVPVSSYGSQQFGGGSYPTTTRSNSGASVSSYAPSAAPSTSTTSDNSDLFTRMMELRRVAESTYNTTKENAAFMARNQHC
ncbi:hypothetical protein FI667_g16033, partial [Globisporangium splendens]